MVFSVLFLGLLGLMWSFSSTNFIQMALLHVTKLDGLYMDFLNNMALIMIRLSVQWLSMQPFALFLVLLYHAIDRSVSLM